MSAEALPQEPSQEDYAIQEGKEVKDRNFSKQSTAAGSDASTLATPEEGAEFAVDEAEPAKIRTTVERPVKCRPGVSLIELRGVCPQASGTNMEEQAVYDLCWIISEQFALFDTTEHNWEGLRRVEQSINGPNIYAAPGASQEGALHRCWPLKSALGPKWGPILGDGNQFKCEIRISDEKKLGRDSLSGEPFVDFSRLDMKRIVKKAIEECQCPGGQLPMEKNLYDNEEDIASISDDHKENLDKIRARAIADAEKIGAREWDTEGGEMYCIFRVGGSGGDGKDMQFGVSFERTKL